MVTVASCLQWHFVCLLDESNGRLVRNVYQRAEAMTDRIESLFHGVQTPNVGQGHQGRCDVRVAGPWHHRIQMDGICWTRVEADAGKALKRQQVVADLDQKTQSTLATIFTMF